MDLSASFVKSNVEWKAVQKRSIMSFFFLKRNERRSVRNLCIVV